MKQTYSKKEKDEVKEIDLNETTDFLLKLMEGLEKVLKKEKK
jgi:hypothetical protein